MQKAFLELSKKEKAFFLILLVLGYISPAIGVLVFFFVCKKQENRLLRYASLTGAALALLVYIGNYMYLLWS